MKGTQRRYTDDKANEILTSALRLIQENYYYKFSQIAEKQNVHRVTYLRLSKRNEGFETMYRQIKEALQFNIQIAVMKLMITPRQAILIERNYISRWK